MFADDFQLYLSAKPDAFNDCISAINDELSAISQWALCNGLLLNPAKTQAIMFSNRRTDIPIHSEILLNGICIPISSSVRDLGVMLSRDMKWVVNSCQYLLTVALSFLLVLIPLLDVY